MNNNLNIKQRREEKKMTVQEMASAIGVTRQTYTKYEKDPSSIPGADIKKISKMLDLSYENILENTTIKEYSYNIVESKKNISKKENVRIDIPKNNIEKFKQVFLYILKKVGAKPNVGQTVLYKLLYFIDFDYYETYEEQLMGLIYVKNKYGPTPIGFADVVKEMEKDNQINEVKTSYFNKDMLKYLPCVEPDLSMLTGKELNFIDRELEKHSDKNANEISELSHKDIPWISAKMQEPIDYEAVFYRNEDTSVREYNVED